MAVFVSYVKALSLETLLFLSLNELWIDVIAHATNHQTSYLYCFPDQGIEEMDP